MNFIIQAVKAFQDNYIWMICDFKNKSAICIDPGSAPETIQFLKANDLDLVAILITHHHQDHIGGVHTLYELYPNAVIYGPMDKRISRLTHLVNENTKVSIQLSKALNFDVIETPGHTMSHVCYYNQEEKWLFCGDTLFSGGCGRLFEGSAADMLSSLNKLKQLDDDTLVYCAHEYTKSNLAFAATIEPSNQSLIDYKKALKKKTTSLPSSIALEKSINPFLRTHLPSITNYAKQIDPEIVHEADIFGIIRAQKDIF